jgi:hypothetical protein
MRRALLLLLLTGCARAMPRIHPAPLDAGPAQERFPEVEEFEPLLEQKGRLIDALFAIDRLVDGEQGRDAARDAFQKLLSEARPLAEAAAKQGGAYGAALEILGLLRREGFDFDGQKVGMSYRYASVTSCLLARRGICVSFTLLTMALLDSCGQESCAAVYPRHVLVRVWNAVKEIEVESTNFGDPTVMDYPEDLASRAEREGYIFCRSLNRGESAWLYLSERLWRWALRRPKDARSFRLLERAEVKLNGSDDSISTQWAFRHQWRSNDPALSPGNRAESRRLAIEEYERLIHWNPGNAFVHLLLSLCHESAGDPRSELLALKRFMDGEPEMDSASSRMVQARWWIRRRETVIEEFRLTPEDRKRGDDFLMKYFPDSDPGARVNAELWKLLEIKDW